MGDDSQPPILASDAERERAASVLREASIDGRLTLDEFTQRIGRALAARTRNQLDEVTRDLPAVSLPQARRAPVRWSIALLGGVERRGFWRVGEESWAVAMMGGCNLDLRGAAISAPVTTINAISIMGGVDVIVPEGVEVELAGVAIMGSKSLKLAGPPPGQGAPVVRVNAFAFMGSVTVRDRPSLGARAIEAVDDWPRDR